MSFSDEMALNDQCINQMIIEEIQLYLNNFDNLENYVPYVDKNQK